MAIEVTYALKHREEPLYIRADGGTSHNRHKAQRFESAAKARAERDAQCVVPGAWRVVKFTRRSGADLAEHERKMR